jgi:branched-chain amino acid:cation transporter, LIVCS family
MGRIGFTLVSGLALFSMFFGAGNIIFPFILGAYAGGESLYAILGFIFAGVAVPFLGLIGVMLYGGDNKRFFGTLGARPGFWLFALLIALLGPIGSIPRLITVSYATLNLSIGLPLFSLLSCVVAFLFAYKRGRVVEILGAVLTPVLLLSLVIIIWAGLSSGAAPNVVGPGASASLWEGIHWGYSLLDMVAAFLYAAVVLKGFQARGESKRVVVWQMGLASGLAGLLLCATYTGLTLVGARYVMAGVEPEAVVRAVCMEILGPWGGFVASMAVGLACLTTVISLTMVCSDFLKEELLNRRHLPAMITLGVSFVISNLGFMGIARLIGPILDVLHPGLILLCLYNIIFETRRLQVRQLLSRSSKLST